MLNKSLIHFDGFVDGPAFSMRLSCFAIDADVPMDTPNGGSKTSLGNLSLSDSVTAFTVTTLDASLVAPGDRDHLLFYDGNTLPNMTGGMHINLLDIISRQSNIINPSSRMKNRHI